MHVHFLTLAIACPGCDILNHPQGTIPTRSALPSGSFRAIEQKGLSTSHSSPSLPESSGHCEGHSGLRRRLGSALQRSSPVPPPAAVPTPGRFPFPCPFFLALSLQPSTLPNFSKLQALCSSRTSDLAQRKLAVPAPWPLCNPLSESHFILYRHTLCACRVLAQARGPARNCPTFALGCGPPRCPFRGVSRMGQARFQYSSPGARRQIRADRFQTRFPRMRAMNPLNYGGTLR